MGLKIMEAVWLDGIKSDIFKIAKKSLSVWATSVGKFVTKKFQKSFCHI